MPEVKIPITTRSTIHWIEVQEFYSFIPVPEYTRKALQSLAQNKKTLKSDQIIYSDEPNTEK